MAESPTADPIATKLTEPERLRHGTIARFSSSQQDGDQAPFSICECVDLRVAHLRIVPFEWAAPPA